MRRIVVTGANKGIGKAIVAAVLSAEDDAFVFLGSRDPARGEAARQDLLADQPGWAERLAVLAVDVTDDASVEAAVAEVGAPLYALVNNAGVAAGSVSDVLAVNTRGVRRATEAFLPLLSADGRVVVISSASGPSFVSNCRATEQARLIDPGMDAARFDALLADADAGFGADNAYGLSKALVNSYVLSLANAHPELAINACTPGFIETDLTRPWAESQGKAPRDMGMKPPAEGTRSALHLLFGDLEGNGRYYGSDAVRSPLDRYRSPGDPPHTGE